EIEDVKARLRDYADRVTRGDADFSTLAIAYSEDGSAMQGGELGFTSRSQWVPEFANVAFNLNDPKKVSRIVETEYGYHIIQLIAKRGDQVNVRHILLRPHVSTQDLALVVNRLDSVRKEIVGGAFTFEDAARTLSQDKDTRNNRGLMVNPHTGSPRFEMQDLPSDIANRVEGMEVGDISEAFVWKDPQRNKEVAAIVRLAERVPGHRATLAEDYSLIRQMYENHQKQQIIRDWIEKKIKDTYVKIEEGWESCDFNYQGWIK
ncbi:MAG: peptidyl-prolyl cis-trans isomerase, partial [Muribaculaceae bacterium]|nr:peptidyl-prolyl cis-trans isomerase [Muribaculaceae bacterium]